MAYRYLWTPLALGPATARNRIVFSAHLTNYARDGLPTEQHADYYAARAAAGAGRVVVGVLLGGEAGARVVREVGAEHDPVAGRGRPGRQRGPEVPVRHRLRRLGRTPRRGEVPSGGGRVAPE